MSTWVCSNGHANAGDSTLCSNPGCAATRPGGVDSTAWFVVLLGLFAGPAYPVAGGLAVASMAATYFLISRFTDVSAGAPWLIMAVPAVAVFWATVKFERNAAMSGLYRMARDLVRLAAGVAILAAVFNAKRSAPLPPAEIIGAVALLPIAFLALKRLDSVLGLGGPKRSGRGGWSMPLWVEDFIEHSNWRAAGFLGLAGAFLGLALGRDARILSAIVLSALVSGSIMLISGGMAALSHAGGAVKIVAAALAGAFLGQVFVHEVAGVIVGAVALPAALLLYDRMRGSR